MKCNLYSITKPSDDWRAPIIHYQKQCKQFGTTLTIKDIINNDIINAQKISQKNAQKSYTKALLPYLAGDINISLHPNGKMRDTFAFAELIKNYNKINFFIGGAYGFEEEFVKKTTSISLSLLTFSHKIAKIILCEQIYRALSIIHNHPYHK
ncbi:23S rRNA (pseudouridine(1915)-N(3))-methyltransferase RlmH [Helicobacter cappadocius]|uniref:Ribosomal RNA large subunit methyltransferase H n=1 Tax=Helicobacter cappadocius TaxID=3063998 RepID=A0AA90PYG6_9HELI|nr:MULTISPECIES: 23S rRNA (pseudouridine(1915)-N(3))-methyltransferase RlmH [unclassified Helicobacter]MDO7252805.1 23S rRNA (pseudouridine(1915)-N(3))-methyltransferase RlmH [Helicobacter sp. faydin-H75]MDP2538848.1 23S rRNA (pseudouridine(1915)-N(3))-methyltransferase RlmH [Helicobacter sp. faydin-H76]